MSASYSSTQQDDIAMEWNELKNHMNRDAGDAPINFESAGLRFSVARTDSEGQVLFSADFTSVPEDVSGDIILRKMLEANHLFAGTGGASLSVNPDTLQTSMRQSVWIDLLDFERFMIRLEAFVSMATNWNQKIIDSLSPTHELMAWPGNDGFIIA